MFKNKKPISFVTILLLFICIFLLMLFLNQQSKNHELLEDIKLLKTELQEEKKHYEIYELTKDFINQLGQNFTSDMLTGKAKKMYDDAKNNISNDYHGMNNQVINHLDILNIYVTKNEKNEFESYAIYEITYDIKNEELQQIQTLSIYLKFEKVENEYKISDYQMYLLKDSLDEYLQKLAELGKGELN